MKVHTYQLLSADGRPRLRGLTDEMGFLLAVDPRGNIRTLRYGLNGMSSRLTGTAIRKDKRTVGYRNIELTADARAEGWLNLESYYEDAVKSGEIPSMRNFETVVSWYVESNKRKGSGQIHPLVPPGYDVRRGPKGELLDPDIFDGVHKDYLPQAVRVMREKARAQPLNLPAPEGVVPESSAKKGGRKPAEAVA